MKKNLFIAAMFALVMAGCSKNEVIENQTSNNMINFRPYVGVKAVDANNTLIQTAGVGFNVYAWYNSQAVSTAITQNFRPIYMNKINVTYNEGWSYANPKYWPATGSLDFIAIGNNVIPVTTTPNAGEYKFIEEASPAIEFTTSNTPAQQKDLIACTTNFGKTKSESAITFNLKHLLSKIDVNIKNTSDLILEVTSVKFTGIATSSTYSLVNSTWGIVSGTTADNQLEIKKDLNFVKDAIVSIHENNEGLIIIPQTMTSIIIEYVFKDSDSIVVDSATKTVDLTDGGNWAKNTHYTYTLTITPNASKIIFSASVEDWATTTPVEK